VQDILKSKHIEKAWFDKFGSYADDEDVAELYAAFGDLMAAQVTDRATPIPGVIKSVGLLRAMGVKLGSCSGYDERTMSILVPAAKKHGLELEAVEWLVAVSIAAEWLAGVAELRELRYAAV